MGTRGKTARRESDGGGYWRWLRVDYGTSAEGWVAGDLHVVPMHPGKPSLVCEDELRGMRGTCRHCTPKTDVRDLGYLPVYRDDNIPCVLTLHPHQFEMVDCLSLGTPIKWARRGGDDAESTYVIPRLSAARYSTTLAARREPADITIAIARYWKRPDLLPELLRWFQAAEVPTRFVPPTGTATSVTTKPPAAQGRAKTTSRAACEAVTGEVIPELITDVGKRMLKRMRAREANGVENGVHE